MSQIGALQVMTVCGTLHKYSYLEHCELFGYLCSQNPRPCFWTNPPITLVLSALLHPLPSRVYRCESNQCVPYILVYATPYLLPFRGARLGESCGPVHRSPIRSHAGSAYERLQSCRLATPPQPWYQNKTWFPCHDLNGAVSFPHASSAASVPSEYRLMRRN